MIIIERSKFAQLVRDYKKIMNLNTVLLHICRERKNGLTMTLIEICEILDLNPEEVQKRVFRGRLRYDDIDGLHYYDIMDIVNVKDSIDSQRIFRQTMDQAIPDTSIKIEQ